MRLPFLVRCYEWSMAIPSHPSSAGHWVRTESFWREVAANTLGGVFAAVIVAVGGVLVTFGAGLIALPLVWRILIAILIGLAAIALSFFAALGIGAGNRRLAQRWKLGPTAAYLVHNTLIPIFGLVPVGLILLLALALIRLVFATSS